MKSQISKLRESKRPLKLQWLFLVAAVVWLAIVISNIVMHKYGLAVLGSLATAVSLMSYVAICQHQTNRELLREIDSLREELKSLSALEK